MAIVVTACDAKVEDTPDSKDERTNPPQKQIAEDKAAMYEDYEQPKTLEERRAMREALVGRQTTKLEDREDVPEDQSGSHTGEVPESVLSKIIEDLVANTGADRTDIEVLHAESLVWNDGSLGCGKPGQNYTQAIVPGYRVILVHAGQRFDYRASEQGFFILCEQPSLAAPGDREQPPAM